MEQVKDVGWRKGGLANKYNITKTDGSPTDPKAKYFVLRLDTDPHARAALVKYIKSVEKDNPELSSDLVRLLESIP